MAVSDNVNGAWSQVSSSASKNQAGASPSRAISLAVYELHSSRAAASGLTITINGIGGDGMSATAVDLNGIGTVGVDAFDSAVKTASGSNTETGSVLTASANDLVLGFFASWDYGDNAASTGNWNLIA